MYYGCLDGTFDNDADGIYGETTDGVGGLEIDLLAEVYVGRAPVDSATEVSNFVKKTINYENSEASYLTSACMVGEKLDDSTYGDDYMEEVKNGSSANGYTTTGLAGSGYFSFSTLYERDRAWTKSDLSNTINNGVHILNHNGHANNTTFGNSFTTVDADALTNSNYFLGFTQGCYSGAFDNRTTTVGTYETSDCVLEHFVTQSGGAFAFLGNSRYGWYMMASTDGPSQRFHREFWDAIMAEGIVNLGKALEDAKADSIKAIGTDAVRWCYFELNLFGDPHTPVNAAFLSPTEFSASNIAFSNASWNTVRWKNSSRVGLTNTMIRYRTDGVYAISSTDGTLLCERAATPGAIDTFNHTDIAADVTYHYVGFGCDGTNYEGGTSVQNRANVAVMGIAGSSNTGRSNCFVATVCYGSADAREVNNLRKFRDKFLLNTYPGTELVAVYYAIGPYFASLIEDKDDLKIIVRQFLQPLAECARILNGGR